MSFDNPNQVNIGGNANSVVHGDQNNYAYKALRTLAQNAAPNACYDSEQRFPPPNCHEGTRLQILEKLSSQIEDKSKTNSVLWLYGSAGVGKSAIAQHLAEKYAKSGRLGAAFFFSRSDSTRNKIGPLVASIAYQFCQSESPLYTTLAPAITDVIRSNPNIFRSSCESQVEKLIIKACSNIDTVEQENSPNVIIIDGLDECINRAEQDRVLAIVRALISHSASYFSWIILLCSRPEPQIRYGFDDKGFKKHLETFDVNSLDDVNRDIHRYLASKFATLRTKYRRATGREGSSWPGKDVIRKLVARADGQFIFAATVIKYIDVDYEPPQDRLDVILRIYVEQGKSPYSPLDMLYHQILSSCHKWDKVKPLLRLLVTPHHDGPSLDPPNDSLSHYFLWQQAEEMRTWLEARAQVRMQAQALVRAQEALRWAQADVEAREQEAHKWRSLERFSDFLNIPVCKVSTLLIRLHSVLQIPDETDCDIQFVHATFPEFLADPKRSGEFYTPAMSKPEYCDCVATLLLRTLAAFTPSYPLYHIDSFDSNKHSWFQKLNSANWLVAFSCKSWNYYCSKVISPSADLLGKLEKMDVHVIVAISLELHSGLPLDWDDVIRWAKVVFHSDVDKDGLTNYTLQGLRDSRIDAIVEKLEMTMMEVHIAFATTLNNYQARRGMFERIFNIEQWLFSRGRGHDISLGSSLNSMMFPTGLSSALSVLRSLYSSRSRTKRSLIVPREVVAKVSNIIPVVHVIRDDAHAFHRLHVAPHLVRLLLGYVVDGKMPVSDPSQEKDLVCFARVFKQRLAMLSLDLKWSEGSFWLVDTMDRDSTRAILRGSHPTTASHPLACTASSPDSNGSQAAPQSTGMRRARSQSPSY
ncbi:hypothetical protein VNI00_008679 [Paramarasmius palmivorus]|uniref:NACHT domain-containing protein n=1 Tax=Paramarasmius palmivorus TaxID=297713 RepID=A0AAW0CVY5_9AGAR